ncbi:MAG: hypothetical protein Q9215_006608 [Flavoplaca cf. flavocitrina]
MTDQPRPCLTGLPPELFRHVLSHTAVCDLLAFRLASREFRDHANESCFFRVITRTDKTAEQLRQCPTAFLSQHAKELRISVVEWLDGQNGPACHYVERNDSDSEFFHDQVARRQAELRYQSLGVGYLNLLRSLGGLRRILFANGRFNPHITPIPQCGRASCTYQLPVRKAFATHHETDLHFNLLIKELARRDITIKELIVIDDHDSRFVLHHASFGLEQPLPQAQIVFNSLTKLHLDLDTTIISMLAYRHPNDPFRTSINQTLMHAQKLKNLSIRVVVRDIPGADQQNITTVFHTCVFPELKTCILSGFKGDNALLRQFLAGCPNLEELCIDWWSLFHVDSWEEVADGLKDFVSLKYVQLTRIFGTLGNEGDVADTLDDVYGTDGYTNRYGLVQDFFLRNGLNPFSAAGRALERIKHAEHAEEVMTPGWYKRLQKHHGYVEDN